MPKIIKLDKTYPRDALEKLYRSEGDGRIKERLLAILYLYDDKSVKAVSALLKVSENTVRDWRVRWNEKGYQGLKPQFSGGYAPQLSDEGWDKVIQEISGKGMTLEDVRFYIKDEYNVSYSYKFVWKKLRMEKKVKYGKAYIENGKMPKDVEERIKKSRSFF